jgi:hypothetical protein
VRVYRYAPGPGHTVKDVRSLWLAGDGRGIWLSPGWVPPDGVLPGPSPSGVKGAVRLTRTQACWLLTRWRVARRRGAARVAREVV